MKGGRMMKRFRKDVPIISIPPLVQAVTNGHYVFYKNRPLHPTFVLHMSLATVIGGIKGGLFYQAVENEKSE